MEEEEGAHEVHQGAPPSPWLSPSILNLCRASSGEHFHIYFLTLRSFYPAAITLTLYALF